MKNAKLKPFLFTGAVSATVLVSTAAHAQSSVTLYGFVEEEVEYVNNSAALGQTSGGKSLVKMTTASWRASRFGLKGNED
ncbi:porin, partial [Burkholderia multivorans]